ncbi:MAG: hypothetical protein HRF47_01175 [Chloroflexota bacterium]|jgi:hypothetical protein
MSNGNNNAKELKFTAKIHESPQELANLLQQIAGSVDALTTVEFTIKVVQPAVEDEPPAFTAVRQAFADPQNNNASKVKVAILPDDLQAEPQVDISDGDAGEIIDWEILFEPQDVEINDGICMVYMPKEGNGIAVWLPKDGNAANVVVVPIEEELPPGGTDSNLKAFRKCLKQQQQVMKKTYARAFKECIHQL